MYNILHALDHLYINLYHVFTNAEMDKYPSFTKHLSQNNIGERNRSGKITQILMIYIDKRTTATPATRLTLPPHYQSPTISVVTMQLDLD